MVQGAGAYAAWQLDIEACGLGFRAPLSGKIFNENMWRVRLMWLGVTWNGLNPPIDLNIVDLILVRCA